MTQKSNRRENARLKAQQLRQAELARQRRQRNAVVSGVVAIVLVVVVVLGIGIQRSRTGDGGVVAAPRNLTSGGILVGDAAAPVTVTLYEDFQCPACKQFETASGPTLDQLRQAGSVKVISKPIAILDRFSKDDYSTRSLNAAACLVDSAPAAYPAFASALFSQQPQEGGAGLPDSQLAALAQQAGAPDLSACITGQQFKAWTEQVTDQSSKDGVQATPTVLVNGQPLADTSPAGLQQAVTAARG